MDIYLIAITPEGIRVTLDSLRCHTASEELGIWLAPNVKKQLGR